MEARASAFRTDYCGRVFGRENTDELMRFATSVSPKLGAHQLIRPMHLQSHIRCSLCIYEHQQSIVSPNVVSLSRVDYRRVSVGRGNAGMRPLNSRPG
jgi:hypothetical protein